MNDYQANFNRVFYTNIFDWSIAADRFIIGKSTAYLTNTGGREIVIEAREQIDGSIKWAVKMELWVLGKDNQYHYEPMPSSRTDEFLKNTRFDTKELALKSLIAHEKFVIDNQEDPPLFT